jgi:hypothetical protein
MVQVAYFPFVTELHIINICIIVSSFNTNKAYLLSVYGPLPGIMDVGSHKISLCPGESNPVVQNKKNYIIGQSFP